jgi:hypothetical protein
MIETPEAFDKGTRGWIEEMRQTSATACWQSGQELSSSSVSVGAHSTHGIWAMDIGRGGFRGGRIRYSCGLMHHTDRYGAELFF